VAETERRSVAGAAFAVLIALGLVAKFFWWIVAVLGTVVPLGLLWWLTERPAARAAERGATRAELVARCDAQQPLWPATTAVCTAPTRWRRSECAARRWRFSSRRADARNVGKPANLSRHLHVLRCCEVRCSPVQKGAGRR